MMADTVTVYPFTSRSVSGGKTYSSTGTDYKAYVQLKNHLIVDNNGKQIMARGKVIMGTNVAVGVEDKIILPAEYVPRNPPILAVNIQPDESGNHHTTIEIG